MPRQVDRRKKVARAPSPAGLQVAPKIQSVTWPNLKCLGEGLTPQVWLKPPHCPQKGTWPRAVSSVSLPCPQERGPKSPLSSCEQYSWGTGVFPLHWLENDAHGAGGCGQGVSQV